MATVDCCCRSLELRNDLVSGFDAAVAVFEAWMPLLLLRAVQALGFFVTPGAMASSEQLSAKTVPAYSRFREEMLAMLQRAGLLEPRVQSNICTQSPLAVCFTQQILYADWTQSTIYVPGVAKLSVYIRWETTLAHNTTMTGQYSKAITLRCAGFLDIDDAGIAVATAAVASSDTARRLALVEATKAELEAGPAVDIVSSIALVWTCMEALPRILTGDARCKKLSAGNPSDAIEQCRSNMQVWAAMVLLSCSVKGSAVPHWPDQHVKSIAFHGLF